MKTILTYSPFTETVLNRIYATKGRERGKAIMAGVLIQLSMLVAVAIVIRLVDPAEYLGATAGVLMIMLLIVGVAVVGIPGAVGMMVLLGTEATYAKVRDDIPAATVVASLWIYFPALVEQVVNRLRRQRMQVEVNL